MNEFWELYKEVGSTCIAVGVNGDFSTQTTSKEIVYSVINIELLLIALRSKQDILVLFRMRPSCL